jgi:diguanylate cyclase (GGDEF)-like protein/PAS domain S-box-containing protein
MNMVKNLSGSISEERPFLSFKWKISLLSSLILLAVVLLFCTVSYLSLMTNFENQRDVEYKRYTREIDSLIKNASQDLRQLAELIPFLDEMGESLLTGDGKIISEVFDQHLALLQFHNGVEFVRFYNQSNELTAHWEIVEEHLRDTEEMISWVSSVNELERPINPLVCEKSCLQYTIAPLLVDGQKVGVVAIGISMADALLAFKRMSGADIGLLLHDQDEQHEFHDALYIHQWNTRIIALTNRERNYEVLSKAEQEYPDLDQVKTGVQISWVNFYQQIKLFPLIDSIDSDNVYLVVITDVTSTVNNIYESIWKIAFIGFLGLITSEILLFVIFTRLLSRLKDIAYTLPLLANGRFENFRTSLIPAERKHAFRDEIDMLYEAAVTLSVQLERLENQVSSRTKMLIEQRDELSKERDFVANLLDTAQVIVLTQNSSGKITSLNAYGEMLTHYTEAEIRDAPFLNILVSEQGSQDLPARLEEIHHGQREQLRHEAITHCKDGTTRHVAWLHSRLAWNSIEDPSILSVGLDITEYKRVEGHLAWLADHDPLTNLFNRRRFSEELEQILSWADRYKHPGALLFFDLDRFKYINDTSGHQAGDALLRMVAGMLSRTIRADDITGRLGGDEFAVILPEINTEGAIEVAKKILTHLSEAQLTMHNRTHKISASIGIALFPEHGGNVHDLLAAADLAMYHAKETGRNAWYLFSDQDHSRERMHTLVYWKEKIEYSHLNDNFILFVQPIMNIHSDQIKHYEVLLRMRDKDGSILSPADFIPAAEQTGLIHAIDHMVLRKAIALAAKTNQNSTDPIGFSINLSAHAFNDPELLPILKQELLSHNVNPGILVFEITETAALENLPGARSLMKEIKELGCGFVLDDFGVGFSSFYYLRELPVDAVKIDGSFIRNLVESEDDQILVNALCSVARGFGKKITAEFVENQEILTMIKKMEIDYAQGYFVGKPTDSSTIFQ